MALISVSGVVVGQMPVDKDSTSRDHGALGPFVVECKNGEVRMLSSTCPDSLCVKQGAIRTAGQSIICLPNQVTITLNHNAEGGMDAVAH